MSYHFFIYHCHRKQDNKLLSKINKKECKSASFTDDKPWEIKLKANN